MWTEKWSFCDFFFFFGGGGGGVTGWMWTKNWSFCENSKKKNIFFFFWGGSGGVGGVWLGGGVRVDVNKELKFLWIFKKKNWGGGGVRGREGSGWGGGGQGGCDRRIEVFGKIHTKKISGGGSVWGRGVGGGQGGCEWRIEVFVKIQKKKIGGGGGGGRVWGVRMDVNEKLKFLWKFKKKKIGGGGGVLGWGGQGGCERRIEVFVKIQKKIFFFFFFGGGGQEGGRVGWVRVDVNEELEFLWKFKKKNFFGWGGGGWGRWGWGVGLGGSGWMWTKKWSFWENSQKKKLWGGGL